MKKKQKKQAELLEKRIQEMEEGAPPEGGEEEEEDDEELTTTTTTESTEDTTLSATVSLSATMQDIASHSVRGERSHTNQTHAMVLMPDQNNAVLARSRLASWRILTLA